MSTPSNFDWNDPAIDELVDALDEYANGTLYGTHPNDNLKG